VCRTLTRIDKSASPVFEIVDKSAAELFFDGLLGFLQEAFDGRVSDGQRDDAARRQRAQQPGEPAAVVARLVRVVALGEQHLRRVLVHDAQVDASAEVPLEGVIARGQAGRRDVSGEQRPGDCLCAVELQGAAPRDPDELAAHAGRFGVRLVVRAAHQDDGGARAVATFGSADVKGSPVFYQDVTSSHGYVFGAVGIVCENYSTCEKAAQKKCEKYIYIYSVSPWFTASGGRD